MGTGARSRHTSKTSRWCRTGSTTAPSYNGPAWSIASEWFAYLCAPALFLVTAAIRRARTAVLLAGLAYAVMLLVFAAKALPNGNLEHMFYVRIGGEFVGGAALCLAWIRGGLRLDRLVWPLAIGLLAVIWLVPDTHSPGYWLAPGFGLFVAAWLLHVAVERPCRDLLRARRS